MNSVIFFKSDPFKSHSSKRDVQCVTGVTTESHRMLNYLIFLLLTRVLFFWIIHWVQKLMMHMLTIYWTASRATSIESECQRGGRGEPVPHG
jgi:hypothetical protein